MKTADKYMKFVFTSGWDNEMVIAFLKDLPFNSFEERDDGVIAYLPQKEANDALLKKIYDTCERYSIRCEHELVENKNWNAIWESKFEPVAIDNFCLIKAAFHKDLDTSGYEYVIDITPEMTFGTGHHETTWMMIKMMSEMNLQNKKILDFGAGTGILSILAEKMGAKEILAVDNDPVAVDNIKKNAASNDCKKIKALLGDTVDYGNFVFDAVFANINRNVLLEEAQRLSLSLKKGGFLLLSGILTADKQMIVDAFEGNSMKLMKSMSKDKWSALKFIAY